MKPKIDLSLGPSAYFCRLVNSIGETHTHTGVLPAALAVYIVQRNEEEAEDVPSQQYFKQRLSQ